MLQPILDLIKTNIQTNNPKTFVNGYAGARQHDDGKILVYDNNEGTYVGLQDSKNNFFYIRYKDDIPLGEAASRSTSCAEIEGNAPLRLVAWVKDANLTKLVQVLMNDLLTTDFDDLAAADRKIYSDISISLDNLDLDPEEIYKEETGQDKVKGLVKGVVLVALDFTLIFNYKQVSDDCLDRNICERC